jgi:hypothetical protein
MIHADRTATVTLACPATIVMNGEEYPCEAPLQATVRAERDSAEGVSWWHTTLDEIASPCGHALSVNQEHQLLAAALEELANRAQD